MEKVLEDTKDPNQSRKVKESFVFENLICVSIFVVSLAVYTKTLCPTVFWWDSGELIANIKVLGIPHRPGFPIYVLLGKFFSFLPFGTFAFKVNFLSSWFASFSLAIFGKIFLEALNLFFPKMLKKRGSVLVSTLSFVLILGFTYSFWIQAVRAEVYSLNVLFFSLLLFLTILYLKNGKPEYIYLFFFLFGLGLGNHHLSLLSSMPALLFLFLSSSVMVRLRSPQVRHGSTSLTTSSSFAINPSKIPLYALFFLLGLSIYLYLPIRSLSNPLLAWGKVKSLSSSASSVFAFDTIRHLNLDFLSGLGTKLSQILLLLSGQLTFLCFTISLLGLFLLCRYNRRLLIFLLLLIAADCAVVIFMTTEFISTNPDLHGYLIFSVFTLAFFYGIGVFILLNFIRHSSFILRHAFLIIFAAFSLLPLFKHYQASNLSHNRIAYNYGLSVITELDSNSVLFVDNVNLNFIIREIQYAEGRRKDVTILDRGLLSFDWYVEQKREEHKALFSGISDNLISEPLFRALLKKCQDLDQPTYIEFTERDSSLVNHLIPHGYVFNVFKTRIDRLSEKDLLSQKKWDANGPFDPQDGVFQRDWDAQRVFALSYYRLGLFYEWKGMASSALDKFSQVSKIDPENEEIALKIKRMEALQKLSETSLPDTLSF